MLDWLSRTFGFTEKLRFAADDGTVNHAEMEVAEQLDHAGRPRRRLPQPEERRRLAGPDPGLRRRRDAHYAQAKAAGAEIRQELADMPYGDRRYDAYDAEGHLWMFSTHVRDVAAEDWGATGAGRTAASRTRSGSRTGRERRTAPGRRPGGVGDLQPLPATACARPRARPPRARSGARARVRRRADDHVQLELTLPPEPVDEHSLGRGQLRQPEDVSVERPCTRSPPADGDPDVLEPHLDPRVHAPSAGVRTWRMFSHAFACGSRPKRERAGGRFGRASRPSGSRSRRTPPRSPAG